MVNLREDVPTDWDVEDRQEHQMGGRPGLQGLRRPDRRRRQDLRRHQQRSPAQPARHRARPEQPRQEDRHRQGHPDVLQRGRRQVPLAGGPRQAGRRPRQRLAAAKASAPAPSSRATASGSSATAARWSAPTPRASRDGKNDGVQDEKYKDKTDADFIWQLDMIGSWASSRTTWPSARRWSSATLLFVITSNGVDEGHINIPSPRRRASSPSTRTRARWCGRTTRRRQILLAPGPTWKR